jgi:hypothetical protein
MVESVVVLAAVGFAVAFLITSNLTDVVRVPVQGWLAAHAEALYPKIGAAPTVVVQASAGVRWFVFETAAYLLSCRKCLACQTILWWSLVNGWPGFGPVLAAMGVAVYATERIGS